jgi:hypothetical protein
MDDFELDWYNANNAYKAPVNNTPYFPEYDFDYGGGTSNSYSGGNNTPYTPAYDFDYGGGGGGGGGGGAWWDTPSFTPQFSAPAFTPTFTAQQGLGPNPYAMGAGFSGAPTQQNYGGATATMQAGAGPTNIGATTFAGPNTTVTAPTSSDTGGRFGVTDDQNRNTQPALLESASVGLPGLNSDQYNSAYNTAEMMGPREQSLGQQAKSWVRDPENRDTVRLGIQGLGALAGYQAQRDAGKLAKEQMGLQAQNMAAQKAAYEREMALREEAMASQRQALGQNQQMAQRANQESIRSFDEARSLYNPQELGIRGMAQQRGATQRSIEDTRKTLASRGMSAAAIEAEVRRQRVAGATGESAAYMRGLDTGRSAQAGALSSAKALGATMPGLTYGAGPNAPTFTPNYGGADFYARQGAESSKALRDLLESYANYPTLRAQEEARRDMQRGSLT